MTHLPSRRRLTALLTLLPLACHDGQSSGPEQARGGSAAASTTSATPGGGTTAAGGAATQQGSGGGASDGAGGSAAGGTAAGGAAGTTNPPQGFRWRNVVIGAGGFVPGIVFHPDVHNLAYARTDMGGGYRWDGAAEHWTPLTDFMDRYETTGIEAIALDAQDPNRVYFTQGTASADFSWNPMCRLLRSADRGDHWDSIELPFRCGANDAGRSMGERLAVDPNLPTTLFLGTRRAGLWKSTNRGSGWTQVTSFPVVTTSDGVGLGFVLFDGRSGSLGSATGTLYVGVAQTGGLYRSTNGGTSWEAVPGQPADLMPHRVSLGSNGMLYVTYANGPGPNDMSAGAVWKLNTGNGTWTDITPSLEGTFGYAGLAIDPRAPDTVVVATMDRWWPGDEILRSTNGGASWTAIKNASVRDASATPFLAWGNASMTSPGIGNWVGSIALNPFDAADVMYGTGATIWGTHDFTAHDSAGGTSHWTPRVEGFEETAVIDLASPPSGPSLLSAIGDVGGFVHDDVDASPARGMLAPLYSTGTSVDFAEAAPAIMVRTGGDCEAALPSCASRSIDAGVTWTAMNAPTAAGRQRGHVALAADGQRVVWSPIDSGAYVSTNEGTSWTACAGLPGTNLTVIADRQNANRFYALANGTLYASNDGASTFTARATGLTGTNLRAVFGLEGNLWLAGGAGLFRSTDGGDSFARVAGPDETRRVGFGKAAPGQSHPAVFVSAIIGGSWSIYRSDDAGATWIPTSDDSQRWGGLGGALVGDPRVYTRYYLGTNGRGIILGEGSR